ncbi:MAG: hypothetical protein SFY70_01685 [Bacteroidia bacterium]|nr:hypothetical protein [Bacteroidia bacterium]
MQTAARKYTRAAVWRACLGLVLVTFSVRSAAQTDRAPRVVARVQVEASAVSDTPVPVSDGKGGVFIVFRSTPSGQAFANLYAQHVLPDGTLGWGQRGRVLAPSDRVQLGHRLLEDGQGGFWVVWDERAPDADAGYLMALHLASDGTPLCPQGSVRLTASNRYQRRPSLATDFKGGLYVGWEEQLDPATTQLFLQRLGSDGKPLWGPMGQPVLEAPEGLRDDIQLASAPGLGVCALWEDQRTGKVWELYAKAFDLNGRSEWRANGVACTPPGSPEFQFNPALLSDGFGGLVVVYERTRIGQTDRDLVALRLNRNGNFVYHKPLAEGPANAQHPRLLRKANEAWLCWVEAEAESGLERLKATHFELGTGQVLLPAGALVLAAAAEGQSQAGLFFGYPLGGLTVVWNEATGGERTYRAQRLTDTGTLAWGYLGQALGPAGGLARTGQALQTVGDERGGFWAVWMSSAGFPLAQHYDPNGTPWHSPEGLIVSRQEGALYGKLDHPAVAEGLGGEVYLAYEDYRAGAQAPRIYLQRLGPDGQPLWPEGGLPVALQDGYQELPVVTVLRDGVCVGWTHRRPHADENLYLQLFRHDGTRLGPPEGIRLCAAPRSQTSLRLARFGDGNQVLAAWTDARDFAQLGFDIYHQLIDETGRPLLGQDGTPLAPRAEYQVTPELLEDGLGGAYIAWMDQREGPYQLRAQRLDGQGNRLWGEGGRVVAPSPENQRYPALARIGADLLIAWSEDRTAQGQSRVFLQSLEADGSYTWGRYPQPITLTFGSQTVPQVAGHPEGILVGWLDQRHEASSGFNLFLARHVPDAPSTWPREGVNLGKFLPENADFALTLTPDGRFGYCAWADERTDRPLVQYARCDVATGHVRWHQLVPPTSGAQRHPRLVRLPGGRMAAVWLVQHPEGAESQLLSWVLD